MSKKHIPTKQTQNYLQIMICPTNNLFHQSAGMRPLAFLAQASRALNVNMTIPLKNGVAVVSVQIHNNGSALHASLIRQQAIQQLELVSGSKWTLFALQKVVAARVSGGHKL